MSQSDDRTSLLVTLIRKFCRGEASRTETNNLVRNAGKSIKTFLRDKVEGAGRSEKFESREQRDEHLDALAENSIAGLFERKDGVCKLCYALRDVLDGDDGVLVGALERIMTGGAESHFYHEWRYNDPISFLLCEGVKDAISQGVANKTIIQRKSRHTCWIVSAKLEGASDLNASGPLVTVNEIAAELSRHANSHCSLRSKIEQFLYDLTTDATRCWYVDQQDLINAVRTLTATDLDLRGEIFGKIFSRDPLLRIAVDKAVNATCTFCRQELDGYVAESVFTDVEAQQLAKACNDMVHQWAFDGSLDDHLGYLKAIQGYAEHVTPEAYNSRYKTRIEYVMKRAKALFKDTIRKNYGN